GIEQNRFDNCEHVSSNPLAVVHEYSSHALNVVRGWIAADEMLNQAKRHKRRHVGMIENDIQRLVEILERRLPSRKRLTKQNLGIGVVAPFVGDHLPHEIRVSSWLSRRHWIGPTSKHSRQLFDL